MGFNTNITICNDNLRDYEKNPERFFRLLKEGIYDGHVEPVTGLWGITVHTPEHADATQLIAAGQNFSTRVYTGWYTGSHHTEEGQVALLRQWADSLGYRISKKPAD
ncbi:hypothetical protein FDG57_gp043 [Mycobacterium phage Mutaforma13]|uniref:Uncharacterized protein n=1 Tax=Mycobacterium phage Mutaforma13 TaxID=2922219 RepID=G1DUD1_9CAUD|nr:hypothetical protein FDG57_gp043 [Mycobacterium phage Mutaforma13]AEJ93183.1 hypothetical protein MUTAFORMA13_43 [Mycobacterium phage Mutaforma13]